MRAKYVNESIITDKLFESKFAIPRTKLNGTFWHDTSIDLYDDIFTDFNYAHSDWDAIWLADDESVAQEFSDWHSGEIQLVYEVEMNLNPVADISYELSQRMEDAWAVDDFREVIPILRNKGFKGWVLPGSIDTIRYNDIAVFNPDDIHIQQVKMYIDDDWTDFMDINTAIDRLSDIRETHNDNAE